VHTLPNVSWFDPFISVDYVYTVTRAVRVTQFRGHLTRPKFGLEVDHETKRAGRSISPRAARI
jgi:hypothetical protein